MYDGMLGLRMPNEAILNSFVDDLVVVIIEKHSEELYINENIYAIKARLPMLKLNLADEKRRGPFLPIV